MFLNDEFLPNAILIEYIPKMQMIDLSTFSKDRLDKLVSILKEIHGAKILHRDPYPRNMMVVPGNPDRILWIDFDRAQIYSNPLTPRQREWFDGEAELMKELAEGLVSPMIYYSTTAPIDLIANTDGGLQGRKIEEDISFLF
jgi:serine/threonine protein kinase